MARRFKPRPATPDNERASPYPSSRGHSAGTAGSGWNDFPDRKTGKPPIATRGEPSTSPDVNASIIMQNMVMNDDDKEWYEKLFKKQARLFLRPNRSTVRTGFEVGLNAGIERVGRMLEADLGTDHRTGSYGLFITVPVGVVRQLEALYPRMATRADRDDSPLHVTVLYIGGLTEDQATVVRDVCESVLHDIQPFDVEMQGTDHFHNADASVFHVRVGSDRLTELHHTLRSALESSGIPVSHAYGQESDGYCGHITMAYLPPGEEEPHIPVTGSWVVDRIEVWNMSSPVSLKLGGRDCLGCASGSCRLHVREGRRNDDILVEPDDVDADEDSPPQKHEFSAVGAAGGVGAIRGYTLPMRRSRRKR